MVLSPFVDNHFNLNLLDVVSVKNKFTVTIEDAGAPVFARAAVVAQLAEFAILVPSKSNQIQDKSCEELALNN